MSELTIDNAVFEPREDLKRVQTRATVVGAIGLAGTVLAYFNAPPAVFYRSYLVGWLLWVGVALGSFALSMLNHVSGGRWGLVMRRVFEAAGRTLPFLLLLGIPVALGHAEIFPGARPEAADDPLLHHKITYLSTGHTVLRSVAFFALWSAFAYLMSAWSHKHDETGDESLRVNLQRASALGLVLYVVTATLASVDWIMATDPHWFSSLFGLGFVVGQGLSGFAFSVPMMLFLSRRRPLAGLIQTGLFHAYGKLMLAFVMLWSYLMISQYLIIWSGNLPEEVGWYLDRSGDGWQLLTVILVLGHFALPFVLLLSQDLKKKARLLSVVAFWVIAMRWLDLYWQVAPSTGHPFHWADLVTPVAVGGIWVTLLMLQIRDRALVPVRDPALEEVLAHG